MTVRPALRIVEPAPAPSLDARIRQHLADLDRIEGERRLLHIALAAESRRLADAHRLTLRPTIEQMRRMVAE